MNQNQVWMREDTRGSLGWLAIGLAGICMSVALGCTRQGPTWEDVVRGKELAVNAPLLVKNQGLKMPTWFRWPPDNDSYGTHVVVGGEGRQFLVMSVTLRSPFEGFVGDYGYHFVFDRSLHCIGHFPGGTGPHGFGLTGIAIGDLNRDGRIECATAYWDPDAEGPAFHGKHERLVVWQFSQDGLRILLDVRYASAVGTTPLSLDVDDGTITLLMPSYEAPPKRLAAFTWDSAKGSYSGDNGGPEIPWEVVK
jgi:hypothetical protein